MNKHDELEALRRQQTDELDLAISAMESESWEQGFNAGRVDRHDEIVAFLAEKGIAPKIIEELQDELRAVPVQAPLTITEYVGHALRTENIDFKGIRERLSSPTTWGLLRLLLRSQIQVGMLMEAVKKHIFYGKPLPDVVASWPLQQASAQLSEEQTLEQLHRTPEFGDQRVLRLLHALAGIVSEAGEMTEPVFQHVFGQKPLDVSNLAEEAGDNQWYIAVFTDVLRAFDGPDMEAVMQGNVAKLKARYEGKGFSTKNALERDTDAENKAREAAQG